MTTPLALHPLADRFKALDPNQVLSAIDGFGYVCTGRLLALNSYENRVYQIETEDGQGLVAKFYRPGRWTLDAIEDEHDFMFELAEQGVPVACPLALSDGYTVDTLDGAAAGIHFCLFDRVRGRVNDEPSIDQLRDLGRLLARIHATGEAGDAPHRPRLSLHTYGHNSLENIRNSAFLPDRLTGPYLEVAESILEQLDGFLDEIPVHRIHGDCHLGNLLWKPEGPVFLDFDDFCLGPAVQDIWLLAPGPDEEARYRRAAILEGYRDYRPFDERWVQLIEPLRALRMIRYTGWIASRWYDPTFKRTFGQLSTPRWWGEEANTLREQLARLR
ncbi:MAG: serine/threonine protein kinase [Myxococcota bacterium]|nr:serine/threonine protein kinase [Myxococcota bacterium]